mgnify:CR=1 FL=1
MTLYHNGNDAQGLMHEPSGTLLDVIGDVATSNTYWDVAGVSQATKDHTIVRKASVLSGNGGDWATSAGTSTEALLLDAGGRALIF